jgi:1,2-diacylglycerol 3-beta-galactosyltransferase
MMAAGGHREGIPFVTRSFLGFPDECPLPSTGHPARPSPGEAPLPLLFLIGDTGGGHRSAAQAVAQALRRAYPGRFVPVIHDALRGPGAPLMLRWQTALYGPGIRLTPWLWGLLFRGFSSPRVLRWYQRTLFRPVNRSVARAVAAHRPAVIAAFHGFTAGPAVRARDRSVPGAPVVTVITDLASAHLAWRDPAVDRIIAPSAQVARSCAEDGMPEGRYLEIGLPVAAEFVSAPAAEAERLALRRSLGLAGDPFLVVLTGGAEGSGGLYRRAAAVLRHLDDVEVAVICGRNRMLQRRLDRLAARAGGRLAVRGFVSNMADWLRCADVVVGKAGPSTIAEATCCAAPLVLTSWVPGNEDGNADMVVSAGAGRYAPRLRDLVVEVGWLRRDPAALAAMRAASASLSRPAAAAEIASLLARLAGVPGPAAGCECAGCSAVAGRSAAGPGAQRA